MVIIAKKESTKCPHCGEKLLYNRFDDTLTCMCGYERPRVTPKDQPAAETPFTCPECDNSFGSENALNVHRAAMHSDNGKVKCPDCGKTFKNERGYKTHYGHVHNKPDLPPNKLSFECAVCGKSFSGSNSLSAHMASHRYDDPEKILDFAEHKFRKLILSANDMKQKARLMSVHGLLQKAINEWMGRVE